jgi:hypothetical protein
VVRTTRYQGSSARKTGRRKCRLFLPNPSDGAGRKLVTGASEDLCDLEIASEPEAVESANR